LATQLPRTKAYRRGASEMTADAYGNHLCDDCLRRQAQEDLVIDDYLYSLCQSCYKDRLDQKQVKA
jgi:hypothetical protein